LHSFCDVFVTHYVNWLMFEQVQCCKGFKRSARHRGYSILRVSAKYTDFDIKLLYVLAANDGKLRRLSRKAHTIQALIGLGQECGTHIASMYPEWAHFKQDPKEWKPSPKKNTAKRIKKAKKIPDPEMTVTPAPAGEDMYIANDVNSTVTFTTTTTDNTWYGGSGTGGNGGTF